jgi:hypothetical protein
MIVVPGYLHVMFSVTCEEVLECFEGCVDAVGVRLDVMWVVKVYGRH